MVSLESLLAILSNALKDRARRSQLINNFQQRIWHDSPVPSEEWAWDILRELAYDLDFYVADETTRREDPSYYGDDRAEAKIQTALEQLKAKGTPVPS